MVEHERRSRQRFPTHLPIVITTTNGAIRGVARDVSSGGVFFYVDDWPLQDTAIEFKMLLPSEITFSESERVVCRGRVVRMEAGTNTGRTGIAVAIDRIDRYELCQS
jgi:hypothetical protein